MMAEIISQTLSFAHTCLHLRMSERDRMNAVSIQESPHRVEPEYSGRIVQFTATDHLAQRSIRIVQFRRQPGAESMMRFPCLSLMRTRPDAYRVSEVPSLYTSFTVPSGNSRRCERKKSILGQLAAGLRILTNRESKQRVVKTMRKQNTDLGPFFSSVVLS